MTHFFSSLRKQSPLCHSILQKAPTTWVVHTQKLSLLSNGRHLGATFTWRIRNSNGNWLTKWLLIVIGPSMLLPVLEARIIIFCCCCKYIDATETVVSESKQFWRYAELSSLQSHFSKLHWNHYHWHLHWELHSQLFWMIDSSLVAVKHLFVLHLSCWDERLCHRWQVPLWW
jgi:hypothetical protein